MDLALYRAPSRTHRIGSILVVAALMQPMHRMPSRDER
jgi:hypothetical protein